MAKKQQPVPAGAARPKPDRLMRAVVLAWVVAGALLLMTLFKVMKAVGEGIADLVSMARPLLATAAGIAT